MLIVITLQRNKYFYDETREIPLNVERNFPKIKDPPRPSRKGGSLRCLRRSIWFLVSSLYYLVSSF